SYAYVFDRGYVMQDAKGKPIRMLGAMMDITERKQAEQARIESLAREQQARAEAEKANKIKDEFLAMVSHGLRTPLTTIKTATRLLRRNTLDEAERRECLNTIAIECDRQIDLVLNLLDLSRVESGALNLQPARVEVSDVLKSCYELERQAAELSKHQLELELPAEPLPPARADAKALRRALCGLVENAIKYTSEGGTITLRARPASSTETGDEVAIGITDTGRGIAPEDLPHVFDKFYRGRSTRPTTPEAPAEGEEEHSDPNTPGVGLGLYLANTIIQQLGGRIIVESVVGEGSTFTVYLPVWQEEDEEERSVAETDDETVAVG
ncbi:MAG: ATP-binding protein, partial [Acidobacteriota bacterium]|nr:ATP-binding protein [Acidobacteriota bacterium]